MPDADVESRMLRVYCVSDDRAGHLGLHDAIIAAAQRAGLAGASVLTAKMGLSRTGRIYSNILSDVESDRQPLVVEILDRPDRIQEFLPVLHGLVQGRRLITIERALVAHYPPKVDLQA